MVFSQKFSQVFPFGLPTYDTQVLPESYQLPEISFCHSSHFQVFVCKKEEKKSPAHNLRRKSQPNALFVRSHPEQIAPFPHYYGRSVFICIMREFHSRKLCPVANQHIF